MSEETNQDNRKKLLVVDDEDRIRRLLKMYLEKADYSIEEAEDGQKALDLSLIHI